jgi:hypothetical protein
MNPEWRAANPKEHVEETTGGQYKGYYDAKLHAPSLAQQPEPIGQKLKMFQRRSR